MNVNRKLAIYGVMEALRLGLLPADCGVRFFLRLGRVSRGGKVHVYWSEDEVFAALEQASKGMAHGGAPGEAGVSPSRKQQKASLKQAKLRAFMETGVWPTT